MMTAADFEVLSSHRHMLDAVMYVLKGYSEDNAASEVCRLERCEGAARSLRALSYTVPMFSSACDAFGLPVKTPLYDAIDRLCASAWYASGQLTAWRANAEDDAARREYDAWQKSQAHDAEEDEREWDDGNIAVGRGYGD